MGGGSTARGIGRRRSQFSTLTIGQTIRRTPLGILSGPLSTIAE